MTDFVGSWYHLHILKHDAVLDSLALEVEADSEDLIQRLNRLSSFRDSLRLPSNFNFNDLDKADFSFTASEDQGSGFSLDGVEAGLAELLPTETLESGKTDEGKDDQKNNENGRNQEEKETNETDKGDEAHSGEEEKTDDEGLKTGDGDTKTGEGEAKRKPLEDTLGEINGRQYNLRKVVQLQALARKMLTKKRFKQIST